MNLPEHPDTHLYHAQVKSITRGGTQAADDMAMEAMWQALVRGESKEDIEKVFFDTFSKARNGINDQFHYRRF